MRIRYKDSLHGYCSTSAWVVWAFNHLNQRRQFAFDGARVFYQPTTRSSFEVVNERDLPQNAREALAKESGKTLDQWNAHFRAIDLAAAPKWWMRIECIVQFPSPIGSDQAFDEWMRAMDKVRTESDVHPRSSKLIEVRTSDPAETDEVEVPTREYAVEVTCQVEDRALTTTVMTKATSPRMAILQVSGIDPRGLSFGGQYHDQIEAVAYKVLI